jgi:heme/copper-type cytochrome/quinol oxidase subunit 2
MNTSFSGFIWHPHTKYQILQRPIRCPKAARDVIIIITITIIIIIVVVVAGCFVRSVGCYGTWGGALRVLSQNRRLQCSWA